MTCLCPPVCQRRFDGVLSSSLCFLINVTGNLLFHLVFAIKFIILKKAFWSTSPISAVNVNILKYQSMKSYLKSLLLILINIAINCSCKRNCYQSHKSLYMPLLLRKNLRRSKDSASILIHSIYNGKLCLLLIPFCFDKSLFILWIALSGYKLFSRASSQRN